MHPTSRSASAAARSSWSAFTRRRSRLSRRSPVPCLVFNFHNQFEALRANGKFDGMQKVIRRREIELQGSINPVLARYGDASEARQYSGVAVSAGWKCPFHQIPETHDA